MLKDKNGTFTVCTVLSLVCDEFVFIANYSASVAGVLNEPDKLICTSIEGK